MKSLVEQKTPFLSEEMNFMTVTKVFISVGDEVESGQPIVEVETDKVVVEIPSDFSGTVQSIEVSQKSVLQVGDVMCSILAREEISNNDYSSFVSALKMKLELDEASSFNDILRTVEQLKT